MRIVFASALTFCMLIQLACAERPPSRAKAQGSEVQATNSDADKTSANPSDNPSGSNQFAVKFDSVDAPISLQLDGAVDCMVSPDKMSATAGKTLILPNGNYLLKPTGGSLESAKGQFSWHFNFVIGSLDEAQLTSHLVQSPEGLVDNSSDAAFARIQKLTFPLPQNDDASEDVIFSAYIKSLNCINIKGSIRFEIQKQD